MNQQLVYILLIVLVVLSLGLIVGYLLMQQKPQKKRSSLRAHKFTDEEEQEEAEEEALDAEDIIRKNKEQVRQQKRAKRRDPTVEEQLFMAGKFSARERADFHRKRKLAPIVFGVIGGVIGMVLGSLNTALMGGVLGVVLGAYIPIVMLRKWVERHHEELAYNLPLLIEQISIGVSSSLDIGPCLTQVVDMADERNSHNAATEMLKYALFYVKSGVSLEEALIEIGRASRQPEFKHALLALAQVAKFGGEISKQLQDLADSTAAQREAKVEAKIRQLELKASGPVALVFVSYMVLLGLGIAAQMYKNAPQ
jgi:Flp pilus assembly protein TadB